MSNTKITISKGQVFKVLHQIFYLAAIPTIYTIPGMRIGLCPDDILKVVQSTNAVIPEQALVKVYRRSNTPFMVWVPHCHILNNCVLDVIDTLRSGIKE